MPKPKARAPKPTKIKTQEVHTSKAFRRKGFTRHEHGVKRSQGAFRQHRYFRKPKP
jgi:hypothetical protein